MRNPENNIAAYPPSHVVAARQDQTYFKELLSPELRRVHQEMDRVLDQLEYEGSPIFDEYPDKNQLERLGKMIYRRLWPTETEGTVGAQEGRGWGGPPPGGPGNPGRPGPWNPVGQGRPPGQGPGGPGRPPGQCGPFGCGNNGGKTLQDLLQALLYEKIYNRRCRYRRNCW